MRRDLSLALRSLARTPAFALPAVLSLALGLAINTTMFSVVNAMLLRPLGRSGGADLVRIGRSQGEASSFRSATYEELTYLREHGTSFTDIAGHQLESVVLTSAGGAARISAETVTGNYFSLLRVAPALGRAFGPDDDRLPGGSPAAVISHGVWRLRFNSDPAVVGSTVRLNGHPVAVIGVAPDAFHGTFPGVERGERVVRPETNARP